MNSVGTMATAVLLSSIRNEFARAATHGSKFELDNIARENIGNDTWEITPESIRKEGGDIVYFASLADSPEINGLLTPEPQPTQETRQFLVGGWRSWRGLQRGHPV